MRDDEPPIRRFVAPVPLDPAGVAGPTRGQAAGPGWRRTSRGLFVPAATRRTAVQLGIEAAARLGATGAVTGWLALWLHGVDDLAGHGLVLLNPGRSRLACIPGTRVVRAPLPADDVAVVDGVRCTRPERAVIDQALVEPSPRAAVVVVDAAFNAQVTSRRRIAAALRASRRIGVDGVHAALAWSDEHTRSPAETRLRLLCRFDLGYEGLLVNQPVVDAAGRHLGTPDLLDARVGLAIEYDGAMHRSAQRHHHDVVRAEAMRDAGLEVVTFVGADVPSVDVVRRRLRAGYARAGALPRRWRLAPGGPSLDEILDRRPSAEQ